MKNPSHVQATINGYKPEDVVEILIFRDGKEIKMEVILQGEANTVAMADDNSAKVMGATLGEPDKDLLRKLGLRGGVEVKSLEKGKFKDAGIGKGLIITYINQTPVTSVKEALDMIKNAKRGLLIEGVYSNGDVYYYGVGV